MDDMMQKLDQIQVEATRHLRRSVYLMVISGGLIALAVVNLIWGNEVYGSIVRLVVSLVLTAVALGTACLAHLGALRVRYLRAEARAIREELHERWR